MSYSSSSRKRFLHSPSYFLPSLIIFIGMLFSVPAGSLTESKHRKLSLTGVLQVTEGLIMRFGIFAQRKYYGTVMSVRLPQVSSTVEPI